jgi:transketolase
LAKKNVVTAEEHNIFWSWQKLSRVLALNNPAPQEFVAVNDSLVNLEHLINGKIQIKQSSIVEAVEKS